MDQKISWQAPEHSHREKGPEWFWAVSIVTIGIIIAAFFLKNYFFAILIALASATLMMYATKRPRIVDCEINKKGIAFETYFFPHKSIKSFWIDEDQPKPVLLLQHSKFFMPFIVISLADVDHQTVREFLIKYIDEVENHEPIFQKIFEYLGF